MPSAVNWETALSTAKFVSGRYPAATEGELDGLREDFATIIPTALEQVEHFTGLTVPTDSLSTAVVDRRQWISANIESYRYMLEKVTSKVPQPAQLPGVDHASGVSLGMMLGWISSRVLGQYDLLLQKGAASNAGTVYFVGPNIIQIERRFGFQRRQFRHWVALHELTHRAQFEGVAWFRPYFESLMDQILDISPRDLGEVVEGVVRAVRQVASGGNPLSEFGLAGVLIPQEKLEILRQTSVLMSIAEGHGDWVMDRAAAASIPEAWRFSQVLSDRRANASGLSKVIQSALGLEAKFNQYAKGEAFIAAVEEERPGSVEALWSARENLPTPEEFDSPSAWIARVSAVPSK